MSIKEQSNIVDILNLKKNKAREQYFLVGKLLSEGKTEEATNLIKEARRLELEAKAGYLEVGRLLSQGDVETATNLIKSSRQKELDAKKVLSGEPIIEKFGEMPQSIQQMIERADKSTYAFTPVEIQYIASRLGSIDSFHEDDNQAFQTIAKQLQLHGFVQPVDIESLTEKIAFGFTDIVQFYDSQAPEGQLLIGALQLKHSDLNTILTINS